MDYPSDEECKEDKNENNEDNSTSDDDADDEDNAMAITISKDSEPTQPSADLQTKWRKLKIPVCVLKAQKRQECQKELQAGLDRIVDK